MSRERNMIDESARTSAESAFEAIEDMIVTGELPSLHLMSESDLARRTGFGRTPVREALQRLKFVGLVDVLPRRGVVVTAVDINRQLDLLETRRPLEKLMVRLAASRASDEQRNRMSDIADDLREAVATGDQNKFFLANRAVHAIEAQATANEVLISQLAVIHSMSRRFWYEHISDSDTFAGSAELHTAILASIISGDGDAAEAAARALLDRLEQIARDAIVIPRFR